MQYYDTNCSVYSVIRREASIEDRGSALSDSTTRGSFSIESIHVSRLLPPRSDFEIQICDFNAVQLPTHLTMNYPIMSENAMSDELTRHTKNNDYVFRLPTPPRIVIPPFSNWNYSGAAPTLGPVISHADQEINIDFLQGTSYDCTVSSTSTSSAQNWKYENRRQAQDVLSYLWLGPLHAARDKDFLLREGITLILAVQHKTGLGPKMTMGAMRVADELGIATAKLEVASNQELIALFPSATRIINSHIREMHNRAMLNPSGGIRPGKILLFCESGNDKSAAVAAAYLMENFQNVDFVKACQICNARRFCCSFDDSIKHYLKAYDDILRARRGVAAASPPAQSQNADSYVTNPLFGASTIHSPMPQSSVAAPILSSGKSKRTREWDEDDEMMDVDETEVDDADRFQGREFAPFR